MSMFSTAPAWFEAFYRGAMSEDYKRYMRDEWGHPKRGDVSLFEKLSLEGAQAGLSWALILSKREAYRTAFAGFDIAACAAMTGADVDRLVGGDGSSGGTSSIVRHRGKIQSVVDNARCVQELIDEAARDGRTAPPYGHFDAYLWSFVGGRPQLNEWVHAGEIPTESEVSRAMSKALKARGFRFVGPKTCYSLMQSCGLIVDHPVGTPEWSAAKKRIEALLPHAGAKSAETEATEACACTEAKTTVGGDGPTTAIGRSKRRRGQG